MTLRDYEALGEAIREARTSAYRTVCNAPAGTSPVELVMLIHRCYETAIDQFATQVRLPYSIEVLPESLREPVLLALREWGDEGRELPSTTPKVISLDRIERVLRVVIPDADEPTAA